jgi:hypothetical protein
MLLSLFEERDLPRRGREAVRRGREARGWLTTDERARVIGLVVASVAVSIAMSLLVTALVGFVSRRRNAPAEDAPVESAGIPVMDIPAASPTEAPAPVET